MNEGSNSPIAMALEELGRDECLELLGTQSIGRLAVADHGYYPPHIVPVNFTMDGEQVIFRSDAGLKFKLSILAEHSVSFEIDSIDASGRTAWSVVLQGRAELLTKEEAEAITLGPWLQPWAPGERQEWVRIVPYTISGRRLRPAPVSLGADSRWSGHGRRHARAGCRLRHGERSAKAERQVRRCLHPGHVSGSTRQIP